MILPYSSFAFRKDSGISVILGMTVKMVNHIDIPMLDPMPISLQGAHARAVCIAWYMQRYIYSILLKIMLQNADFE